VACCPWTNVANKLVGPFLILPVASNTSPAPLVKLIVYPPPSYSIKDIAPGIFILIVSDAFSASAFLNGAYKKHPFCL